MGQKVTADMLNDLSKIRQSLLLSISQTVSPERFEFAKKELEKISDNVLFNWTLKMLAENGMEVASNKEMLNDMKRFYKERKISVSETAYGKQMARYIGDDVSKEMIEKIKKSTPSDIIYLSKQEDEFLKELWNFAENMFIPSDLFFAKTIPLHDCEIVVDETADGGIVCKYRVVVFDDYEEKVDKAMMEGNDDYILVGAAFPENNGNQRAPPIVFPIVVVCGVDALPNTGYAKLDLNFGKFPNDGSRLDILTNEVALRLWTEYLATWYGIQIALLHPSVRDVFKNPKILPLESSVTRKTNSHRRRKVRYIRKHYLTLEKLETVSNSKEERKINRKCLAWYVIGHWRTYKNGKKVFITPYWKGALRNLRKNADGDMRERKIDGIHTKK